MGIWKYAESWVIAVLLLMTTIHHFNLLTFLSLISRLSGCSLSSTHSGSKQRHVLELQKSYFQQKFTCVCFYWFCGFVCFLCSLLDFLKEKIFQLYLLVLPFNIIFQFASAISPLSYFSDFRKYCIYSKNMRNAGKG